jgi:3',5'-cyclic AMP phosphodiesterase CpdA
VTRLLQVSDAHFGTERPQVVEALISLSARLAPQLLVLSGDVTQRARRSQFAAAAAFVRRLAIPRLLSIPGNHDLPLFDVVTRAVAPYAHYLQAFGPELEPSFSAPDCLVLGVKTTRRYRHADGEISAEQRERIAQALRGATPEQTRLVVLHQPIAVPRLSEAQNVVHGADAAIHAWHDAGADIILGGHIHLPFVLPLHELRQLSRPLWAVNAGTAISARIRHDAGNSVNVLDVTAPRRAQLQQWTYSDAVGEFVLTAELNLG